MLGQKKLTLVMCWWLKLINDVLWALELAKLEGFQHITLEVDTKLCFHGLNGSKDDIL
jgi:hypothetical protein